MVDWSTGVLQPTYVEKRMAWSENGMFQRWHLGRSRGAETQRQVQMELGRERFAGHAALRGARHEMGAAAEALGAAASSLETRGKKQISGVLL